MGIEIVANLLRLRGERLSLIQPCFDNLADIYNRHGIPLEPLDDDWLMRDDFGDRLDSLTASAIAIVSPNNPTGTTLSQEAFRVLLDHCRRREKLLVLDSSFRFFNPDCSWDQLTLLHKSGVDYLVIEDTGKTWPTHELKIGTLIFSSTLADQVRRIYTDFILHVSPFVVRLLTEFIQDSASDHLAHVRNIISTNRRELYKSVADTVLQPVEEPFMSLSWLRIREGATASEIQRTLADAHIYVLPGYNFFWANRERGAKYVRIALARDPRVFRTAARRIGEELREEFHNFPRRGDREGGTARPVLRAIR